MSNVALPVRESGRFSWQWRMPKAEIAKFTHEASRIHSTLLNITYSRVARGWLTYHCACICTHLRGTDFEIRRAAHSSVQNVWSWVTTPQRSLISRCSSLTRNVVAISKWHEFAKVGVCLHYTLINSSHMLALLRCVRPHAQKQQHDNARKGWICTFHL